MEWLNLYGLAFIAVIMIPNIIYAIKCKEGFENKWHNKIVELLEQIGRFGCFAYCGSSNFCTMPYYYFM